VRTVRKILNLYLQLDPIWWIPDEDCIYDAILGDYAFILECEVSLRTLSCYNNKENYNVRILNQGKPIVKISKDQPWRVWAFVIGLNLVGFIGLYFMQGFDLHK